MGDAIRRRVRRRHVLVLWWLFALTQAVLAAIGWLEGDALRAIVGSGAAVLGAVAGTLMVAHVRVTRDGLIRDLVVRRQRIPWSAVERVRFEPEALGDGPVLTFHLHDGRELASPWYDRLTYPEHEDERRALFDELERTAGRAGTELELRGG